MTIIVQILYDDEEEEEEEEEEECRALSASEYVLAQEWVV